MMRTKRTQPLVVCFITSLWVVPAAVQGVECSDACATPEPTCFPDCDVIFYSAIPYMKDFPVSPSGDTIYHAIANEPFTITVEAADADSYACNCFGICDDGWHIGLVNWGDGVASLSDEVGPCSATHEYTKDGKYQITVSITDCGATCCNCTEGTCHYQSDGGVTARAIVCVGCCESSGPGGGGPGPWPTPCPGAVCVNSMNLSAVAYTDGGGGPSGVWYTSHPVTSWTVGANLPFGSYSDSHNRGWSLIEDRTVISQGEDRANVSRGGQLDDAMLLIDGVYYSIIGSSTAVYDEGAGDFTLYQDGAVEYYADWTTDGGKLCITSATDEYGNATTYEYITESSPEVEQDKRRLSKMTLPGSREYDYSWVVANDRKVLDSITSPDGFKLKFIRESSSSNRIVEIQKIDTNNGDLVFQKTKIDHYDVGESYDERKHLIKQFEKWDLVDGTLTKVQTNDLVYAATEEGEDADGRCTVSEITADGITVSTTMEYSVSGYDTGSSAATHPDGSKSRRLLTERANGDVEVVSDRLSLSDELIFSSTSLISGEHDVILSATNVAGATTSYEYDFSEGAETEYLENGDFEEGFYELQGTCWSSDYVANDWVPCCTGCVSSGTTEPCLHADYTQQSGKADPSGSGQYVQEVDSNCWGLLGCEVGIAQTVTVPPFSTCVLTASAYQTSASDTVAALAYSYDDADICCDAEKIPWWYHPTARNEGRRKEFPYNDGSDPDHDYSNEWVEQTLEFEAGPTGVVTVYLMVWGYYYYAPGTVYFDDVSLMVTPPSKDLLEKVVDYHGNYRGYWYDSGGKVTATRAVAAVTGGTETLSITEYEYDSEDRLTRSYVYDEDEDETLTETKREYDSDGLMTASIDGEDRRTSFEYDSEEKLTAVGIGSATTTFSYDSLDRKNNVVSPLGATTEYGYSAVGNLASVTEYLNISATPTPVVTSYGYDIQGYGARLVSVTDAEGYVSSYDYDSFGRLVNEIIHSGTTSNPPAAATREYEYDKMNRVTEMTDAKSQVSRFEYDDGGRLTAKKYMSGETVDASLEYSYSGGLLSSVKYWDVSCGCSPDAIDYSYTDYLKRLESRTASTGMGKIEYEYDGAGRFTVLGYAQKWTVTQADPTPTPFYREWVYDLANRVVEVKEEDKGGTPIAEYEYNQANQVTRIDYENGAYSTQVFDATYGRIQKISHYAPSATSPVASFEYEYNLDGLRTKVTRENGDYIEYNYDGLNRLTLEARKDSGGTPIWARTYQYDKVGNRTRRIRYDNGANITEHLYYNGLGQLATMEWTESSLDYRNLYSYDQNGNLSEKKREELLSGEVIDATRWAYAWDREDRLVSVVRYEGVGVSEVLAGTVEYKYCPSCQGALSQRIEKNASDVVLSWLRYEYEGLKLLRIDEVYDYDDDTVLEDPADGDDRWRPLNVYVHGPGSMSDIVRAHWYAYDDTGDSWCYEGNHYYTYDALGNVLGVFQYGEFSRWEMDAFGNDLPGGNDFLPMDQEGPKEHLTGKMYDTETGLYYFHARWLDPEVGRFVSREPILSNKVDSSPPVLQPYALADNAPAVSVDPSGMSSLWGILHGLVCTSKNCSRAMCEGYILVLPEESRVLMSIPKPGTCMDADAVYLRDKIKKIRDGFRCDVFCDACGAFRKLGCDLFAGPEFPPDKPPLGWPPNPLADPGPGIAGTGL